MMQVHAHNKPIESAAHPVGYLIRKDAYELHRDCLQFSLVRVRWGRVGRSTDDEHLISEAYW